MGTPEGTATLASIVVRDTRATTRRPRGIGPKGREKFLEGLASGWSVAHAAERAQHDRRRFYELRDADEAFAAAWDEALEQGTQVLEDELHRRAVEGWDEDSFDGDGRLMRRVRRYSPALLIFSLKARRPDVYRDNVARVEVTGAGGGPVELAADYKPTSIADVVRLAADLGVVTIDGEAHEAESLALEEAS